MSPSPKSLPWYVQGDPWDLTQNQWDPERTVYYETIFTQSNGYLGIRGYQEETNQGLTSYREGYLAGIFAETDQAALKLTRADYGWPMLAMITLPELFGCVIELGGETFHLTSGMLESYSRKLDMSTGELTREVVWRSPSGYLTQLAFKRFLSAAVPHLGMQEITLTALNWSGQALLRFELDGTIPTMFRTGDRSQPHIPQDLLQDQRIRKLDDGAATLTIRTRGTDHLVAMASAVTGGSTILDQSSPKRLSQKSVLSLQENEPKSVLHTISVVHSRDPVQESQIPSMAAQIAQHHDELGYDAGLERSRRVWKDRWEESDIVIVGPLQDQVRIRFAIFQTLQMAPFQADNLSIPARGLSFNRYHGLYYWDSEAFILPQFLYNHPEVARHLLHFRFQTLPGARRNAAYLHGEGACFPWMTDAEDGTEQAPWHIGDYLWHQNASIAYAIDHYVRTTDDLAFMAQQGLRVIAESARFWMFQLEEGQDGLMHLNETVGPDELDQTGKDNGYVSLLARKHLRLAATWSKELRERFPAEFAGLTRKLDLGEGEIASWENAADRLHIPLIPGSDIPLQDEFLLEKKPLDFHNLSLEEAYAKRHTHRVVKQADIVLAMITLPDEFTLEQMTAAYDFYEPITVHFSSLSYSSHAVLAAIIGRDQDAYDYFTKGAGFDLDDVGEGAGDGLHAAALAAVWQMVVHGFLGMQLTRDGLAFDPRLPGEWNSLKLSLRYRGYLLKINLTDSSLTIAVEDIPGHAPARILLDGKTYDLEDVKAIKHSLERIAPASK